MISNSREKKDCRSGDLPHFFSLSHKRSLFETSKSTQKHTSFPTVFHFFFKFSIFDELLKLHI